jgi:hypothetical protein
MSQDRAVTEANGNCQLWFIRSMNPLVQWAVAANLLGVTGQAYYALHELLNIFTVCLIKGTTWPFVQRE